MDVVFYNSQSLYLYFLFLINYMDVVCDPKKISGEKIINLYFQNSFSIEDMRFILHQDLLHIHYLLWIVFYYSFLLLNGYSRTTQTLAPLQRMTRNHGCYWRTNCWSSSFLSFLLEL